MRIGTNLLKDKKRVKLLCSLLPGVFPPGYGRERQIRSLFNPLLQSEMQLGGKSKLASIRTKNN